MEMTQQQAQMQQQTMEARQQQIQIDFTVMNVKMQLLALAKDMVKDQITNKSIEELYLDLREEVLGIPNLKNQKENGTNS